MWKGVISIFRVLKPNDWLPSPMLESDDKAPIDWSADDAGGDGAESAG